MNCEKTLLKLVEDLDNYLVDNDIYDVVIGISGGIDSALVAAICSLVPDIKIHGLSMPTKTTNPQELSNAKEVGEAFCDFFIVKSIDAIADIAWEQATSIGRKSNLRKGNMKARLRMMYLYDLAAMHKGIVMDTGNKTENTLGFYTIHGDGHMDYSPLWNLTKTEVYELARFLISARADHNEVYLTDYQREALQLAVDIAPQDGLGITSTDENQIGATYQEVDDYLFNNSCTDPKKATLISERVRKNAFKQNLPVKGSELID